MPKESPAKAPQGPFHRLQSPFSGQILKERGWRSAIVVTSPYHLRRTRFIFERVFAGEGIRLSFYGAEDPWLVPERWWRQDRGLEAVGMEYLKLVSYYIRYGSLARLWSWGQE